MRTDQQNNRKLRNWWDSIGVCECERSLQSNLSSYEYFIDSSDVCAVRPVFATACSASQLFIRENST